MLNKVMMIGRVTRDPELNHTAGGTKITRFGIACNEVYYKDSEKHEKATFTDWTIFNGSGENFKKIVSKGDLVYLEGKYSLNEWTDQEGNVRKNPQFTALSWQLLSKVGASKSGEDSSSKDGDEATDKPKRERPKKEVAQPKIEEEDDIPF